MPRKSNPGDPGEASSSFDFPIGSAVPHSFPVAEAKDLMVQATTSLTGSSTGQVFLWQTNLLCIFAVVCFPRVFKVHFVVFFRQRRGFKVFAEKPIFWSISLVIPQCFCQCVLFLGSSTGQVFLW